MDFPAEGKWLEAVLLMNKVAKRRPLVTAPILFSPLLGGKRADPPVTFSRQCATLLREHFSPRQAGKKPEERSTIRYSGIYVLTYEPIVDILIVGEIPSFSLWAFYLLH